LNWWSQTKNYKKSGGEPLHHDHGGKKDLELTGENKVLKNRNTSQGQGLSMKRNNWMDPYFTLDFAIGSWRPVPSKSAFFETGKRFPPKNSRLNPSLNLA
jgi:hypothetical protein